MIIDWIRSGVGEAIRQYKVVLIVYIIQLILALTIGLQVFMVLEESIGDSISVSKLVHGFDSTVLYDLIHVHGSSLSPLFGQLRWLILAYLIFSIFINGGIIGNIVHRTPSGISFWTFGARYFFRFGILAIASIILYLLWSSITLIPFISNFATIISWLPSERVFFYLGLIILLIWLLGLALTFIWIFLSKQDVIANKQTVFKSLYTGFVQLRKSCFQYLEYYFIMTVILLLFIMIYFFLGEKSGMTNGLLIFLFFIIQQLFILLRIMWKIAIYSGLSNISSAAEANK